MLQCHFCFMFWFFGHEACGILVPQPGVKPTPPALEGEVLTTGPPGKSPDLHFYSFHSSIPLPPELILSSLRGLFSALSSTAHCAPVSSRPKRISSRPPVIDLHICKRSWVPCQELGQETLAFISIFFFHYRLNIESQYFGI